MKELMGAIDELWEEYLDYFDDTKEDDVKDTTTPSTSTAATDATESGSEASFTETKALPAPKSLKVTPAQKMLPKVAQKKDH